MDGANTQTGSVAEAFLRALKRRGVDYVLANAGTDFAPVIEALVALAGRGEAMPQFLTIPHENLAVAMAHGYYQVAGKPAGVMVHVTVGTGNTVCALMNAARDNVPLLLMAGRTPHTQAGHIASRSRSREGRSISRCRARCSRIATAWRRSRCPRPITPRRSRA